MPRPTQRAQEALTDPGHASRGATLLRVAVGAIFTLTLFALPGAIEPAPVAAGSSCTGWQSKAKPPKTIRVLRTGSGRVETVGFRTYVAEVMASGEWPSRLQKATLEAGALATKQYAWYYTMKGHHRPGYVSRGKCYDVRDDTRDQLYRPERANPSARQQAAIDKTWALTLRKSGRFFLTGYRAGSVSTCAGDANGWKLYAKSVNRCARQGWSSKRVLTRYLSPNLKFVWSDAVGPVIQTPTISLKPGNTIADGAATLTWRPVNARTDVAAYRLQRQSGRSAWTNVELPSDGARKADVWLKVGSDNRFRIRAQDSQGRFGPWSYSAERKAAIRGPLGAELGSESLKVAATDPPKIKVSFKGRAAALVARTGPGMGQAKVYVNGKNVATVDLERDVAERRELVWARNWEKPRLRTIAVRAVRNGLPVEFNGFFTLR